MNWNLQDYLLPGEKIAFIFSDASGTNACVAMMQLQKILGRDQFQLFSNKDYFPKAISPLVNKDLPDFKSQAFDLVFTGTSHPDSSEQFEVKGIQQAKAGGIKTISFIDHWVNFNLRFKGLTKDELPDEIWVIDSRAAELALAEGIPANKIRVKGNPYHFYLQNYWVSKFSNKNYLDAISVPKNGYHILFAPDPLSIREIYLKTGFTETDALRDVLEIVGAWENTFLIIKTHPLQPLDVLHKVLQEYPKVNSRLIVTADNCEFINACDLVLGFYSNLLLEARALGKRVIRYFPGNQDADLLKESSYFTSVCTEIEDLRINILKAINEKHSFPQGPKS